MWLIMFYNTFYALDSAQSFWKPMKIVLCLAQTLHHNIQDMNRVNYFLAKLIIEEDNITLSDRQLQCSRQRMKQHGTFTVQS